MNQTKLAVDYNAGPRRRVAAQQISIGAGATVDITNTVPTREVLGDSPYCFLRVGFVMGAGSNQEPLAGIQTDDIAVDTITTRGPFFGIVPPTGVGGLFMGPLWPFDPDVGALVAPDPLVIGGQVNTNFLKLTSPNDQQIDAWLVYEIPTMQVGGNPEERPEPSLNNNYAVGARHLLGSVVETFAASAVLEVTQEFPSRADIGGNGWCELAIEFDIGTNPNLMVAVVDDPANPEQKTAYNFLTGKAAGPDVPFVADSPQLTVLSVHRLLPLAEDGTTLEDGTRVFIVNQDGALSADNTSRVIRVANLNFP